MGIIPIFQSTSFTSDFVHTIGGKKALSPRFREVVNPATSKPIASVPIATPQQVEETIDAAIKAFSVWAKVPVAERQAMVFQLGQIFEQFQEEFVTLLTKEQGKPLKHATSEIMRSKEWCQAFSAQSLPDEVTVDSADKTITTRYTPLGVCAAIVPWNAPMILMVWKIAPALVAGNTVIVKPSPFTPLGHMKFIELAQQILPPGVLSVLSGDDDLGPWLTNNPRIAKISFTGSSATGKLVMQSAASSIKRVTLELGGNDAAIILPDVDPKALAPKLFWAAFVNSGQVCAAAKRLYIHEDVYDELRDELVKYAGTLKVGDGFDPSTDLGPIQNKPQFERVKRHIDEAKLQGLKFAFSGDVNPALPGYFIPISIIDNPPDDSKIVVEEPFGPIVPLLKWKDETDVLKRANNTDYGLSATIWGNDLERADRIARQLDVGSVWVNEFMRMHIDLPFGGHKQSGLGVESGIAGLKSWTNTNVIYKNKIASF